MLFGGGSCRFESLQSCGKLGNYIKGGQHFLPFKRKIVISAQFVKKGNDKYPPKAEDFRLWILSGQKNLPFGFDIGTKALERKQRNTSVIIISFCIGLIIFLLSVQEF